MIEKNQRWAYHDQSVAQNGGEGVTRRILAYTDGLMCVENTFQEGAVGKLHSHPHTQITYVVSGGSSPLPSTARPILSALETPC